LGISSCAQNEDNIFVGCSDPVALNFNGDAQIEDGTCIYEGCTDSSSCNFNPLASIEDLSCEYESCVGCTDETADNYEIFALIDGDCIYDCHDAVAYYGYSYDVVAVGSQCWLDQNLRVEFYQNGDSIPTLEEEWNMSEYGAKVSFGFGDTVISGNDDHVVNFENYGYLYNWYAVVDNRLLCPSGFHVPGADDWDVLDDYINNDSFEIRSSYADEPSWNGSNLYGFSALPGGRRAATGAYYLEGQSCYFWSQTESETGDEFAYSMVMHENWSAFGQSLASTKSQGFSVRCIRD
jgi:uncharacterized protein (TIGR02145 family)